MSRFRYPWFHYRWSEDGAYVRFGHSGVDWACPIPHVPPHLTFFLFGRFVGRVFFGRTA